MTAAIYARRSHDDSDRSAEARSCERQIEHARRYAAARGWTVDDRHIYRDDAVSGAEWKHRPGWAALVATLAPRPPFDVLIVSELSRIGRDTVRTPAAVLQLEEAGLEIHSTARLKEIQRAAFARYRILLEEAERLWQDDRSAGGDDAHRRRAEAGAVTGGRVFGYRNVRAGAGYVHRVIDEAEAAVIRSIFAAYAGATG